jgi:hypothetical protein
MGGARMQFVSPLPLSPAAWKRGKNLYSCTDCTVAGMGIARCRDGYWI